MSYDSKCLQLSNDFLDDHPTIKSPENANKLAQEIQTTIEEWIESAKQRTLDTRKDALQ